MKNQRKLLHDVIDDIEEDDINVFETRLYFKYHANFLKNDHFLNRPYFLSLRFIKTIETSSFHYRNTPAFEPQNFFLKKTKEFAEVEDLDCDGVHTYVRHVLSVDRSKWRGENAKKLWMLRKVTPIGKLFINKKNEAHSEKFVFPKANEIAGPWKFNIKSINTIHPGQTWYVFHPAKSIFPVVSSSCLKKINGIFSGLKGIRCKRSFPVTSRYLMAFSFTEWASKEILFKNKRAINLPSIRGTKALNSIKLIDAQNSQAACLYVRK